MSLDGARWSSTLMGFLAAKGFTGSRLMDFTDAVGIGSANHVIGKAFATVDVGSVAGAGAGVGTGITGLSSPAISADVFGRAVSAFGQSGSKLMDVTDAIGDACVQEMGQATLTSTHTPVFLGTGTVTPGSIAVVGVAWGALINSTGSGAGFVGSQWPAFADAIGQGQAAQVIADGTGTVVISGSPAGPPSGGGGAGVGVLS